MTPWFVMQFLVVPVAMALQVVNQQRAAFFLQFGGLFLRIQVVYAVSFFAVDRISEAYALSGFIFYLVYLILVLHLAGTAWADVAREVREALPVSLVWIAAGWSVVLIVNTLLTIV
jgi:hypothetical protein